MIAYLQHHSRNENMKSILSSKFPGIRNQQRIWKPSTMDVAAIAGLILSKTMQGQHDIELKAYQTTKMF